MTVALDPAVLAVLKLHAPVERPAVTHRYPAIRQHGIVLREAFALTVPGYTTCQHCDTMLDEATEGDVPECEWPCDTVDAIVSALALDPAEIRAVLGGD